MSDHSQNALLFKALGDEQRLKILELLRDGEKCACKLLEYLSINQSSLSYHMKILTASGIVGTRPNGKWTYYHIDETGSRAAIELVTRLTQVNRVSFGATCCSVVQRGTL
ncbi:MAG: winged helix-turn-helix transcriptional regulator [Sphaerochaetaceae bacterium]|nr:winged helix-turn-helix transcriptional regulator [Sphaerochaetaceae bacterium]